MSTHFARALASHGGGTLVLVDATPRLLAVAEKTVKAAVEGGPSATGSVATSAVGAAGVGSGAGIAPAGSVATGAVDGVGSTDAVAPPDSAATGVAKGVGAGSGSAPTGSAGAAEVGRLDAGAEDAFAGSAATDVTKGSDTDAGNAPAGSAATGVAEEFGADAGNAFAGSAGTGVAEGVGASGEDAFAGSAATGVAEGFDTDAGNAPAGSAGTGVADSGSGLVSAAGAGSAGAGRVEVRTVLGDLADAALPESLPAADLVWASRVVHHLPDQQAAVGTLAQVAKAGGLVALAEGGLDFRCLPWDLGIGRPGLEDRLLAAQAEWFIGMREGIEGAVAMPYGWSAALEHAGLTDVDSFGALVHHPSPGPAMLAGYVVHRITRIFEFGGEHLTPDDRETLTSLLDPDGPHHLAARRDLYLTGAKTVHCGRRP
ncbi:methyltransferase domain-containing protein [Amycolatopsis sp. FDAARGOS 1241]|nr:methyltransferase domain-containing protein [Amycolatopsis sp. FDAARGOS 1241]